MYSVCTREEFNHGNGNTAELPSSTGHRTTAAAAACEESLTDFVIAAAEERAEEVLATHTLVPADYFDRLIAALTSQSKPMGHCARRPAVPGSSPRSDPTSAEARPVHV